ncbi:unnamed protein product [Urochloa decumbens]|uniref:Pectin acetylesterase n=1 Tax=Urochloa decumbens TaxID=240449 RepID=A0ABC8ZFN5_9POAL
MATEHTSPPVVRKRRPAGHTATVAAAPLFVLLALLAASSRLPVAAAGLTQPTLVAGAQEKGAVCLDGTPPAYYLQKGFGSGSQSWMVFLEISTTGIKFLYIIAMGHHFLGTRRVKQRMEPNCISEDCAPGKQLSLNSCKKEWTLLNRPYLQAVSVKCLADGGFFLDAEDLSGERFMRSVFNGVVQLQNVCEVLPEECLEEKDPTECFFPAGLIKSICTPTFIVNSEYDYWQIQNVVAPVGSYPGDTWLHCRDNIRSCSSQQIDLLHGFRQKLIHELKAAKDKEDWGMFIDSCFTHCQTQSSGTWHSPTSPRLGYKTVAEAVGDWYFGRRREVKQIDCEYPCNPTCGS